MRIAKTWDNRWMVELPWRELRKLIRMFRDDPPADGSLANKRYLRLVKELSRRKKFGGGGWAAMIFMLAFACHASVVVDQSQIYSSGITEFHWVYEPDYGYLPLSFEGQLIDTINFGFTPWLVDDSQQDNVPPAPPQQPPCCQPGPPAPPVIVTPEPGTILMIVGALLFMWGILNRRK